MDRWGDGGRGRGEAEAEVGGDGEWRAGEELSWMMKGWGG